MATFTSNSAEETVAFARDWARRLRPNDVVALRGDLGAGKTQFVKGLVAACGSRQPVTSPTFSLLHEYRDGSLPVFHFDFYRIGERAELEQIGFEDYLEEGGVVVAEWADRFPELFPERTRWLSFSIGGGDARMISE